MAAPPQRCLSRRRPIGLGLLLARTLANSIIEKLCATLESWVLARDQRRGKRACERECLYVSQNSVGRFPMMKTMSLNPVPKCHLFIALPVAVPWPFQDLRHARLTDSRAHSALTGTLLLRLRSFFSSLWLPVETCVLPDAAVSCARKVTRKVSRLQRLICDVLKKKHKAISARRWRRSCWCC